MVQRVLCLYKRRQGDRGLAGYLMHGSASHLPADRVSSKLECGEILSCAGLAGPAEEVPVGGGLLFECQSAGETDGRRLAGAAAV